VGWSAGLCFSSVLWLVSIRRSDCIAHRTQPTRRVDSCTLCTLHTFPHTFTSGIISLFLSLSLLSQSKSHSARQAFFFFTQSSSLSSTWPIFSTSSHLSLFCSETAKQQAKRHNATHSLSTATVAISTSHTSPRNSHPFPVSTRTHPIHPNSVHPW
jgi:hypothetical protein